MVCREALDVQADSPASRALVGGGSLLAVRTNLAGCNAARNMHLLSTSNGLLWPNADDVFQHLPLEDGHPLLRGYQPEDAAGGEGVGDGVPDEEVADRLCPRGAPSQLSMLEGHLVGGVDTARKLAVGVHNQRGPVPGAVCVPRSRKCNVVQK